MKLEGTPDEVLALLANLAGRVAHPDPRPHDRGTIAARMLERAERDAALARAETAERALDAARGEAPRWGWPLPGEVDLDQTAPPDWIRTWCAAHPLEPDPAPAPDPEPAEPGGVAPVYDDGTEVRLPEVLVRLKTPAERAEHDERTRELAAARAVPARRAMPRGVGDPGANERDGLDVWRVDGRALYQQAKTAALANGATPEEAKSASAYTPADYARLASALEEIRNTGESKPLATLAARLGRSGPGGLEHAVRRAVELGVMGGGTAPQPGVKGAGPHTLTEYGRSLLAAEPDDADDADETDEPDADPELAAKDLAVLLEPTPEQQAAIDALNREGAGIVDRLRRGTYTGPRAEIPDGMVAVKNISIPKALRRAATEARYQGWAIARGKGGHLHWLAPDGRRVVTSSTPGGHPAADLRDLRSAGVKT